MQAPSAILRMLSREEVSFYFGGVRARNGRLGDVPGDDETWEEEHGPTIFAAPIAGWQLEVGEERERIGSGLEGCFGGWEAGKILHSTSYISIHILCSLA